MVINGDLDMSNKTDKAIEKLEKSKEAALKRVAKRLKSQGKYLDASSTHSSHSSSGARTHSSVVTS